MPIQHLSHLAREISVTAAMEPAFDRMKQMLFRPFNLGKWFTIGFCAWLPTPCSAAVPGCGLEHRPGACFGTGGGTPPKPAGEDAGATC